MTFYRKEYQDKDYLRISNFLKKTYKNLPQQQNWFIDRWNFCRYFAQESHDTFTTWPKTVGLWVDNQNEIIAIVNSEGEDKGEAFFQFGVKEYPDGLLEAMMDFAEEKLCIIDANEYYINLRVNKDAQVIKDIIRKRQYHIEGWKETTCVLDLHNEFKVELPDGFAVKDANEINSNQQALAHGRAFGNTDSDNPERLKERQRAYTSLRNAPDYRTDLDLAILDKNNEIASFTTIWYDTDNQIGILEPVGTIPKYRRKGFGKTVIYEGVNRIKKLGAKKMYVGSNQQFYHTIGFSTAFEKDIWQKRWKV
jgi:predicted N-acetyltransferase YhbS